MKLLDKLRLAMKESDFDALIVLDELNQRYLSSFAFTDGFLLITLNEAYLITDFRYYEMALSSADESFKVLDIKFAGERKEFIEKIFASNGVKRCGLEGGFVAYDEYCSYKENYPDVEFASVGGMIERLRQIKTPSEVALMQKAQDITDAAFSHLLKVITHEMTEIDVAVELEYAMRKMGADGFAFETIAVSGDASALPHGTPRNVKLKKGFLTMDFGTRLQGYCSDMTRTIVIGKADIEMKKLYDTVLSAQKAALDFIKDGCDCGEADKAARDIIEVDYKGCFGHSLGHSVGLFIHESPSASPRGFGQKLVKGNIVTVEPGIYLFGKYGCRIEDMVLVEENGVYNFTKSTKELIEI